MSKPDDSAFPEVKSDTFETEYALSDVWSEGGLTKRELAAFMAMHAFLTANSHVSVEGAAQEAVKQADALLLELAKEKSE